MSFFLCGYKILQNGKVATTLCAVFCLCSCLSRSSYTGAETVSQGGFSLYGAITYVPLLPGLEVGARYGLSQGVDIGISYDPPKGFRGDVKVNLMRSEKYLFSIGLGAGYWSRTFGGYQLGLAEDDPSTEEKEDEISVKESVVEFSVPLYNTIILAESFRVHLTPVVGYTFTGSWKDVNGGDTDSAWEGFKGTFKEHNGPNSFLFGGNIALDFGSRFHLVLEVGLFNHLPGAQVSLGCVLPAKSF